MNRTILGGVAAALCVENGVTPRKLDADILRKRLLANGAIL